jgi:plastocyanin
VTTSNAVIVVSAGSEIFSYAAVLDNNTADPIFVVGAEDQPPQPITPLPVPTSTPSPTQTPTATPGEPTSTPTPTNTRTPTSTRTQTPTPLPNQVNIGPGLGFSPRDITITAGQTVIWVWSGADNHSTTSDTGIWDSQIRRAPYVFSHTFPSPGVFPYYCFVHGFPGGAGESGTVTVTLP